MDKHHLFRIPRWLPKNLPPELWSIIFYWKWRLEMKNIHKVLIEKRCNILTCRTAQWFYNYKRILANVAQRAGYTNTDFNNSFWSSLDERNMYTGNYWIKYDDLSMAFPQQKLVTVYNKCGIEQLFPYSMNFSPFGTNGYIKLYNHLTKNLNIVCPKNLDYKDNEYDKYDQYNHYKYLMKLCRNI